MISGGADGAADMVALAVEFNVVEVISTVEGFEAADSGTRLALRDGTARRALPVDVERRIRVEDMAWGPVEFGAMVGIVAAVNVTVG